MVTTTINMKQEVDFILQLDSVPLGPVTATTDNAAIVTLDEVTSTGVNQYHVTVESRSVGTADVFFVVGDGLGGTALNLSGSVTVVAAPIGGTVSFGTPVAKLVLPH